MMMFTRLKNRPIEAILLFVTFNLVAVNLIAIKAFHVSPEILGFSIAAAMAAGAAVVTLAFKLGDPLARLARHAGDWDAGDSPADIADRARKDHLGAVARAMAQMKTRIHAQDEQHAVPLSHLEDGLRRLSNGDLASALPQPFPDALEGLRVRFNRLASMLNLNLSVVAGSVGAIREQARSSQADMAVIAERLSAALPALQKTHGSIEIMQRATRLRGEDAASVSRHSAKAANSNARLQDMAADGHAATTAAHLSMQRMRDLVDQVGTLAIRAESLAADLGERQRMPDADAAPHDVSERAALALLLREFAEDCTETARGLMLQSHETGTHLNDALQALAPLKRETETLSGALAELAPAAERLSRNVDLESQRLSLAQTAVGESETVLCRARSMAEATETALIRIMTEAGTADTRLSLFSLDASGEASGSLRSIRPNLRCVT
ncbi:hypothetical protein [Rhizobium sp. SGZ-381]|uniref:hypothetical protein n=1 Tax=Rhizobium sp. SGZ-381 TaxID=3342800 RepID=UPI00366C43D9